MKTLKTILAALTLMFVGLNANAQTYGKEVAQLILDQAVAMSKSELPETVEVGMVMDDFTYNNNILTIHFTVDSAMISVSDINDDPDEYKAVLLQGIFSDEEGADVFRSIVKEAEANFRVVITGSPSGEEAVLTIPYTDL